MSLDALQSRKTSDYVRVELTDVNTSSDVMTALGRDTRGGLIRIDLRVVPSTMAAVPNVGETWFVARWSGRWQLVSRIDDSLAGLEPGEVIVAPYDEVFHWMAF